MAPACFCFFSNFDDKISDIFALFLIGLSMFLGYISWRFIEQPLRRRDINPVTSLVAAGTVIALILLSLPLLRSVVRNNVAALEPVTVYGRFPGDPCFLLDSDISSFEEKRCGFLKDEKSKHHVLLIGDSHAASLSFGLQQWAQQNNIQLATLTAAYCLPLVTIFPESRARTTQPRCVEINKKVMQQISESHFDLVIVSSHILGWGFGSDLYWTYPGYFGDYINKIEYISRYADVMIIGQFPTWAAALPELVLPEISNGQTLKTMNAYSPLGIDPKIFELDRIHRDSLKIKNVHFLSIIKRNCNAGGCLRILEQNSSPQLASPDYGHLSLAASTDLSQHYIGPKIKFILER